MTRMIIEHNMQGRIEGGNRGDDTVFTIRIPLAEDAKAMETIAAQRVSTVTDDPLCSGGLGKRQWRRIRHAVGRHAVPCVSASTMAPKGSMRPASSSPVAAGRRGREAEWVGEGATFYLSLPGLAVTDTPSRSQT